MRSAAIAAVVAGLVFGGTTAAKADTETALIVPHGAKVEARLVGATAMSQVVAYTRRDSAYWPGGGICHTGRFSTFGSFTGPVRVRLWTCGETPRIVVKNRREKGVVRIRVMTYD